MKVAVRIDPKKATKHGLAVIYLEDGASSHLGQLDIEFSKLAALRNRNPKAMDLLLVAATVYALDKLITRKSAPDCWTREFAVSIPVSDEKLWNSVRDELSLSVAFLTGDLWSLRFTKLNVSIVRPRRAKRSRRITPPLRADVVCLFSGGLDSLVGAINRLETNQDEKLLLVGHHDGDIAGPLSDQERLLERVRPFYKGRTTPVLVRVGHSPTGKDMTLRSRSLIFLALGIYAASAMGPDVPLVIPENGTITVDVPLTPSRRGSCSTRTTHPYFLKSFQHVMEIVGLNNKFSNPFEWKTKGEVVSQCKNQSLLKQVARLSVSCAKRGHNKTWLDRSAKACGRCMPCIYRRASLHVVGLENEKYGFDVCKGEVDLSEQDKKGPNDVRACFSFLKRQPSPKDIGTLLLTNGSLDVSRLSDYAHLVIRAMEEIRTLLRDKASLEVRFLAGI
jgi:7-cyano-7-deazaguanine synthase in queuosine biosynthesis